MNPNEEKREAESEGREGKSEGQRYYVTVKKLSALRNYIKK